MAVFYKCRKCGKVEEREDEFFKKAFGDRQCSKCFSYFIDFSHEESEVQDAE